MKFQEVSLALQTQVGEDNVLRGDNTHDKLAKTYYTWPYWTKEEEEKETRSM